MRHSIFEWNMNKVFWKPPIFNKGRPKKTVQTYNLWYNYIGFLLYFKYSSFTCVYFKIVSCNLINVSDGLLKIPNSRIQLDFVSFWKVQIKVFYI